MYAIVEIAGQQFKVAKDQKVFVHRLAGNEGDSVTFDKVLLIEDGTVTIGAPAIDGAAVVAKILGHMKGDKVIVFKKKRRKGFKKKNGHRQSFTQIQVENITASGFKAAKKTEAKPKAEVAEDAKVEKTEVVAEKPKAETKKASPKKKEETSKEEAPKAAKKPATKKAPKSEE